MATGSLVDCPRCEGAGYLARDGGAPCFTCEGWLYGETRRSLTFHPGNGMIALPLAPALVDCRGEYLTDYTANENEEKT
jgi:hypothetical protein